MMSTDYPDEAPTILHHGLSDAVTAIAAAAAAAAQQQRQHQHPQLDGDVEFLVESVTRVLTEGFKNSKETNESADFFTVANLQVVQLMAALSRWTAGTPAQGSWEEQTIQSQQSPHHQFIPDGRQVAAGAAGSTEPTDALERVNGELNRLIGGANISELLQLILEGAAADRSYSADDIELMLRTLCMKCHARGNLTDWGCWEILQNEHREETAAAWVATELGVDGIFEAVVWMIDRNVTHKGLCTAGVALFGAAGSGGKSGWWSGHIRGPLMAQILGVIGAAHIEDAEVCTYVAGAVHKIAVSSNADQKDYLCSGMCGVLWAMIDRHTANPNVCACVGNAIGSLAVGHAQNAQRINELSGLHIKLVQLLLLHNGNAEACDGLVFAIGCLARGQPTHREQFCAVPEIHAKIVSAMRVHLGNAVVCRNAAYCMGMLSYNCHNNILGFAGQSELLDVLVGVLQRHLGNAEVCNQVAFAFYVLLGEPSAKTWGQVAQKDGRPIGLLRSAIVRHREDASVRLWCQKALAELDKLKEPK